MHLKRPEVVASVKFEDSGQQAGLLARAQREAQAERLLGGGPRFA